MLSRVGLFPALFAATKGATLKLMVSKPASVAVVVKQKLKGRKVKGRYKRKAKKGKKCTLLITRAKLRYVAASGANAFAFRSTKLSAGSYVATITARDADGRRSKPVALKFKVT